MSVTNPTYLLPIVHSGREGLAREIGDAVCEAAAEVLGREDAIDVVERVPDIAPATHGVVIYVGSRAGAQDSEVDAEIEKALRNGLAVLPVIRSSEPHAVTAMLPARITRLNAVDWEHDRPLALATIMRLLGFVEDERRVFLSYVRRDSSDVAEQLHRALQESQFDVFLDRFAVPPAEDFQRRLTEDLADMAFLLVLESDGVQDSPWVQYEVNYALTHRIGALAVTLPDVAEDRQARIDEAFRLRLSPDDLSNGGLTSAALRRVLERIDISHACALRRRREQLLGSLVDHLEAAGRSCEPLSDWAIIAAAGDRAPGAFLVTPRRPDTEDLRTLERERERANSSADRPHLAACVVHDVADMAKDHAELLRWVGAPRNLSLRRIFEADLEVAV